MSIDKKLIKNLSTGDALFLTPEQQYQTNASLKTKKSLPVVGSDVVTTAARFKVQGFPPTNRFLQFVATEGEFNIQVPGPLGAPENWQSIRRSATTVNDSVTCSVSYQALESAASKTKHHPELLGDLVRDVVICRNSPDFDKTPAQIKQAVLDMVEEQVISPPDENQKQVFSSSLISAAEKAGTTAQYLKAWIQGPEALGAYAANQGLQELGSYPSSAALAPYIGAEVQAIANVSEAVNFPQLELYELGRVHGDGWVNWLENALNTYASQQSAANAYMSKTLTAAFGDEVQELVIPAFSVSRGREMQAQRLEQNLSDTLAILDEQERMIELNTAASISQAIDWFEACTSPGAQNSYPLADSAAFGVSSINLECGDEDFARLNPPTLALALTNELAARRGAPAPLVVGATGGAFLPLLLAGGGFIVGGPLGAGVGYAFGKSLEKS